MMPIIQEFGFSNFSQNLALIFTIKRKTIAKVFQTLDFVIKLKFFARKTYRLKLTLDTLADFYHLCSQLVQFLAFN